MEKWNLIWKEIQEYERINDISKNEKLYRYFSTQVDHLKGPLKYEVCLTNACNQNCLHCSNGLTYKTNIFNSGSLKTILEQEPLLIVLTGGEPLLHPEFHTMVAMIKKRGTFLKICTNGIELTACSESFNQLEKYDVIQISFDAADKETYAHIRGSSDFENLLENIRVIRRRLPEITIELHCVPNQLNLSQIPRIFSLAKTLGADIFSTAPLAYLGRAKREYQADFTSLLQLERELHKLSDSHTRYAGRLFEICSLYGMLQNVDSQIVSDNSVYRCDAGLSTMYIDCDEAVYPCVYLKEPAFRLGYLKDGMQVLIERARIRYISGMTIIGSACEICNLWGLCNGGCMGVAYAFAGKVSPGLDPRCGRFNKDR